MPTLNKILSIDDSRAVHAFLDSSLKNTHYPIVHAMSAKEGISILNAEMAKITLILLDWEMPEKNGPETFDEIRTLTQSIPVIMITSKNNPEDIRMMLSRGVADYIMKPFTPDILLTKIEAVLGG